MNTSSLILSESQFSLRPLQRYLDGIEACFDCASSCWISASALITEDDPSQFQDCIKSCLNTARICAQMAESFMDFAQEGLVSLQNSLLECWEACRICSEECRRLSSLYEHCLICSTCCDQFCRICEKYLRG